MGMIGGSGEVSYSSHDKYESWEERMAEKGIHRVVGAEQNMPMAMPLIATTKVDDETKANKRKIQAKLDLS